MSKEELYQIYGQPEGYADEIEDELKLRIHDQTLADGLELESPFCEPQCSEGKLDA